MPSRPGVPFVLRRRASWWRAACAVVAVATATSLGSATLVGASGSTSVADAVLTGTFTVSFHVVSPAADRKDRTTLDLGFAGECASGACETTVSTLAASCPSGNCGQPPSDLSFASDVLRLSKGEYRGTFTLKTGCTAQGTYYPYAYEQRSVLAIRPTAAQDFGDGPQATKFVGTLQLFGSPDSTGRDRHCAAYRYALDLTGTSET